MLVNDTERPLVFTFLSHVWSQERLWDRMSAELLPQMLRVCFREPKELST